MAVRVACVAINWTSPGFKGRTFQLFVLNRWDFNFCVCSSPLAGQKTEAVAVSAATTTAAAAAAEVYTQSYQQRESNKCIVLSCYLKRYIFECCHQMTDKRVKHIMVHELSTPTLTRSFNVLQNNEVENIYFFIKCFGSLLKATDTLLLLLLFCCCCCLPTLYICVYFSSAVSW